MVADPRWLELLKSTGGQAGAVAFACAGFLYAAHREWIPPLDAWMVHAAVIGLLLGGGLALVALASTFNKLFSIRNYVLWLVEKHLQRKRTREYIPHMTETEQNVIGYLLKHNQKAFTGAFDGGYAVTLISRGIVVRAMRYDQQASENDVPYEIPDHVWEVLIAHKDKITYKPDYARGGVETHPWRVHWMAR
jgi:hypothetical protein